VAVRLSDRAQLFAAAGDVLAQGLDHLIETKAGGWITRAAQKRHLVVSAPASYYEI